MYNEKIENLINFALGDGELTEKEKAPISDFVPITADIDSVSEYPILYNTLYKSFEEKVNVCPLSFSA